MATNDYITVADAAKILGGISQQRVCTLIRQGRLKARRFGERTWLIHPDDLEAVRHRKVGRPKSI